MEKVLGYDPESKKIYYGVVDEKTQKFEKGAVDITEQFIYVLTNGYLPKNTNRKISENDKVVYTITNAEYSVDGYTKTIDTLQRELDKMKEESEKTEKDKDKENS